MEWTVALEIFGLIGGIATVMALLLAPMIWIGSKIDSLRQEVHQDMNEFRKEMKDFHGRLISLETRKNLEDNKNNKRHTHH